MTLHKICGLAGSLNHRREERERRNQRLCPHYATRNFQQSDVYRMFFTTGYHTSGGVGGAEFQFRVSNVNKTLVLFPTVKELRTYKDVQTNLPVCTSIDGNTGEGFG
jgi:hypothetical protein